jgi:hypothetical protein
VHAIAEAFRHSYISHVGCGSLEILANTFAQFFRESPAVIFLLSPGDG